MFSRDAMMARLHDGDVGMVKRSTFGVFFAQAEALLLMDAGPSDALESNLDYALSHVIPSQREHAERFDARVRAQAAAKAWPRAAPGLPLPSRRQLLAANPCSGNQALDAPEA